MGLNLMDRNGPDSLVRPAGMLLADAETLCRKWHNRANGRLRYAWMPRFALSCSEVLLAEVGRLRERYPDTWVHTHLSEQTAEIAEVLAAFPWAKNYTEIYDRFGLLGPQSIFAHAIYLSEAEQKRLLETDSGIAHCPGSNFFLKSGRFPLTTVLERNLRMGLGPDLSMFHAMKDAQYMQPDVLVPLTTLFYLVTLGAARALGLEEELGNFATGKQADFIIVETGASDNEPWHRFLSRLIYTGSANSVIATFIDGQGTYRRHHEAVCESAL
jgi:guanine deaminase